jgi:YD repeat-containing protein
MARVKTPFQLLARAVIILLCANYFGPAQTVEAFHFPWDQGHDVFAPDPPDDNNPPDNDGGDDGGDPVELKTGNFFYSGPLYNIRILDDGPTLELSFTYHSRDGHNGPFGHGWHSTLTSMAIEVTDGQDQFVIIRQGNGRRQRYKLNTDGTFQNPLGIYDRLVENPDGTHSLIFKGGQVHQYGVDGRIRRIEGIDQRAVVIAYDPTGAIASATSATGLVLTFTKGANGKIATVNDPTVGSYGFLYDSNGNLTSVLDPLGNLVQYAYDGNHHMTRITAPSGAVELVNVYDAQDRVTSQTLAQGQVRFFYDNATRTRVQDPRGTTTHNFNNVGFPTVTTYFNGITKTRVWDTNLNLIRYTEGSNTTTFEYDGRGNLIRLTEPSGRIFSFVYELTFDRPVAVTDIGQGITALISYNDVQGLIGITDVTGQARTFPAAAFGLLNTGLRALGTVFPLTSRYQLHQ